MSEKTLLEQTVLALQKKLDEPHRILLQWAVAEADATGWTRGYEEARHDHIPVPALPDSPKESA